MAKGGGKLARLQSMLRNTSRKLRIRFFIVLGLILAIILFYATRTDTCPDFFLGD